jgi:hypothetical protein
VTIPITISGNVDEADYTITDNKIVINDGVSGFIDISLNEDFQRESDEELIVSFEQGVNAGVQESHVITVTEVNVAPVIEVTVQQEGLLVANVVVNNGTVNLALTIKDSNPNDTHQIDWHIPDYIEAVLTSDKLQLSFPVSDLILPEESKNLISFAVTVTDSGSANNSGSQPLSQTKQIFIPLLANQKTLRSLDSDRDGLSDLDEGYSDEDLDGLPAYTDNSLIPYLQPLHINAALVKLAETEPGLKLRLGKFALLQSSDGVKLSEQELLATGLIEQDNLVNSAGYFDFEIHDILPFARSVSIVLPLSLPVAEYSVYRKINDNNEWIDFAEDAYNVVASSVPVNGVCPAPHSELYQAGLNVGDTCLKLFIEDGGVNDADGMANGVVYAAGGVAVVNNETIALELTPEKSSGGGAFWLVFLAFAYLLANTVTSFRHYRH